MLIALEGVDGAGKTTQARLLAGSLAQGGLRVLLTREPTLGATGQRLRAYLSGGRRHLSPREEVELFQADRREHVETTIRPALERGWVVITDRYYYSTAAYQGALGLDPGEILRLNEAFAPRPQVVFLLQVPPDLGIARCVQLRGQPPQVSEDYAYLERVAAIYESFRGEEIRKLDASLPIMELQARIHNLAWDCLRTRRSPGMTRK